MTENLPGNQFVHVDLGSQVGGESGCGDRMDKVGEALCPLQMLGGTQWVRKGEK
ncbi:MAG: hypothetical protein R2867_00495 [Caldilineaceae bacterium]